nr:C40 family peptidase [Auraticoccus cholistanensis]
MADARKRSQEKLAEAQAVLDRLSEEERERLAAEEREAERAAAAAAEEAADAEPAAREERTGDDEQRGQDDGASEDAAASAAVSTGSGRAADAVAFAKAQIGKPYGYGATGPGAYDCSGLTGAAWRAAGVSLPRTSQQQFGSGQSVSIGSLQPGDLVFYYGGISHVAIYVGGGQIVHASRPGKPIGYAPVDSMPIAGARRVG